MLTLRRLFAFRTASEFMNKARLKEKHHSTASNPCDSYPQTKMRLLIFKKLVTDRESVRILELERSVTRQMDKFNFPAFFTLSKL
jgi:hypothetical protein